MKKIICLMLALLMVASVLAGCAAGTGSGTQTTHDHDHETESQKLPDYVGQNIHDYDSEGNFILASSENRVVYTYESGYVVFTFTGETVQKIQQVLVFADEAAASEYLNKVALEAIDKGEVPPTMALNGKLVIVAVSLSTDSKSLGYYYTQSKTKVTEAFEKTETGDEQ